MNQSKKNTVYISTLLLSLGFVLLAIVDLRRGFLFAKSDYVFKNPYFLVAPQQIVLLLIGMMGVYTFVKKIKESNQQTARYFLSGLFLLLIIDVGLYRGVAAGRSLDAGSIATSWLTAFGINGWLKPFALTLSYLLTVWHATLLSCLGAGLGLLTLPRLFTTWQNKTGWKGTLTGALYSLTQPFCSCCAAMTTPGLFRSNQSMGFALSVFLGAPLLNISTLILAGHLLPWNYAVLRILGGIFITLVLSYFISKWVVGDTCSASTFQQKTMDSTMTSDSIPSILKTWLKLSGKISMILIPSMVFGTILASLIWELWPQNIGNSVLAMVLTSIVGSLVMVSTWSEIPLALKMIQHGYTGPAAVALLALPAVNIGSLMIISKVSGSWRMALSLGLGVMSISILIGFVFL